MRSSGMIVSGSCLMQKRIAFETWSDGSHSTSASAISDSSAIGVQIIPGMIVEVRIFVCFRSLATDSAKPVTRRGYQ